jgi:hypothetical protein
MLDPDPNPVPNQIWNRNASGSFEAKSSGSCGSGSTTLQGIKGAGINFARYDLIPVFLVPCA